MVHDDFVSTIVGDDGVDARPTAAGIVCARVNVDVRGRPNEALNAFKFASL